MSAPFADKGGHPVAAILNFVTKFALNSLRRVVILGRYTLICWQQQRLRRAWRRLGQRVHAALDAGEVNPMLTEPVKDAIKRAKQLKTLKDRQYEAIAALREKIRGVRAPEPAPAAAEPPASQEPPEKPGA